MPRGTCLRATSPAAFRTRGAELRALRCAFAPKDHRMNTSEKLALLKSTTRKIWDLTTPYFRSEEKWKARGLLIAIVILNFAVVYNAVLFNDWYRTFFDALEKRNAAEFGAQLLRWLVPGLRLRPDRRLQVLPDAAAGNTLARVAHVALPGALAGRARPSTGWNWRAFRVHRRSRQPGPAHPGRPGDVHRLHPDADDGRAQCRDHAVQLPGCPVGAVGRLRLQLRRQRLRVARLHGLGRAGVLHRGQRARPTTSAGRRSA